MTPFIPLPCLNSSNAHTILRHGKHSSDIIALARRGAQHRYDELKAELDSLVKHFPDLRASAREMVKRGRKAVRAAAAELQPKKKRKMSAKARRAISDAQKARWAKQKAKKG
jgi:hypothetical protein